MESRNRELAFLIADLAGYTALTEAHGDEHAANVIARYGELAESMLDPQARLIECVGDEVLIVAPEPTAAISSALRIREALEREPLFPTLRAGIHVGSVVERSGRYFGATLNLTARVASHARGGQFLCTDAVAQRGSVAGIEFRRLGSVRFKNVAEPVEVFEIVSGSSGAVAVDPVCRMQVNREDAPARLPYGDRTHYFCSFDCARTFAASPDLYASTVAKA
jgi:adenylate cyclase